MLVTANAEPDFSAIGQSDHRGCIAIKNLRIWKRFALDNLLA